MSEKKRYTAKRIFGSLLWASMGLATVVLLGAAMSIRNNKHCKGVSINISGVQNNLFIDKKEIYNMLEKINGGKLSGETISSFNLAAIENMLEKNQWIKNAELFFDNNEMLRVDVVEREPVARIFTTTGSSFYLDTDLTKLPLSDKSSARVPVFSSFSSQATAKADSILLNDVKNIATYILNDDFWMAQIDQVDITAARTFEMIPKVGNQIIVFGNSDNYSEKFTNLLTFYKQVATKVGWNKYSKIDVQYKGQVVAVKRGVEDVVLDSLRTKQIMQNIVLNALKQATDSTKNIQLVQLPDENFIPAASQQNDIPDEQIITTNTNPVIVEPVKAAPVINKTPSADVQKNIVSQRKIIVPVEKKVSVLSGKVSAKPPVSNKKQNSAQKTIVLKSSPIKPIIKSPTKPISQSTTKPDNKIKAIPKAVMPPKNDY